VTVAVTNVGETPATYQIILAGVPGADAQAALDRIGALPNSLAPRSATPSGRSA